MNYDDPVKVIAAAAFIAAVAVLLAMGAVILMPFAVVGAGWMGYRWYNDLPSVRLENGRQLSRQLHDSLADAQKKADLPTVEEFDGLVWAEVARRRKPNLPSFDVACKIMSYAKMMYGFEGLTSELMKPPLADEIEEARYRDELSKHIRRLHTPNLKDVLIEALANSVEGFLDHLPPFAFQSEEELLESAKAETLLSQFSVATTDNINVNQAVEDAILPLYRQNLVDRGLFENVREGLDKLQHEISGVPFTFEHRQSPKLVNPSQYDGDALAYIYGTPLLALFESELPFEVNGDVRFAGTWIVAPPGRGKTTLLSVLLESDLDLVAEGKASVILMDSKGDLIDHAKCLAMFAAGGKLEGKLTLIEPWSNLAINPLDLGASTGHTIALLEYVFSALLESKMTPLQSTLFRAVLIATKAIPNATFLTFREILIGGWQTYERCIRKLDREDALFFFGGEFDSQTYKKTREELLWRIRDLTTRVPLLRDMFRSPKTQIDMAAEMDAGKVIIIDNSAATLSAGSEFFSRFFVALVLAAAEQRATKKASDKMPVYFYLDEAHTVIARDDNIATIIQQCRSQKIAMVFAHQALQQIKNEDVKTALSDCAIRVANSDEEASQLAPRLRCEPDFLRRLKRGQFAVFIRDRTKKAISLSVPNTPVSGWPKMTGEQLAAIRHEMREKYCYVEPRRYDRPPEAEDEFEEEDEEIIDAEFVEVRPMLTYDPEEPPSTPQPKRKKK